MLEVFFFSGIGGSGLSAIARFMAARGHKVSGSDRSFAHNPDHPALDPLRRCGITIYPQDGTGITPEIELLVFSTAVETDQPELVKARTYGIPLMTRPDFLAALSAEFRTIAVAGTSGKSTTSGLLAFLMDCLGMQPNFIGGGRVKQFRAHDNPGNSLTGTSDLLVMEACESDGSIVHYRPEHTLLLNLDLDHHSIDETASMFAALIQNTRSRVLLNANDQHLLKRFVSKKAITFSLQGSADYCAEHIDIKPLRSSFSVGGVRFQLSLPGLFNICNALACIAMLSEMGISLHKISEVLPEFSGIERRFDIHLHDNGRLVIDDYAHNPHKIAAMMQTLQPLSRSICYVFQPHGYGPTRMMKDEYISVFTEHLRPSDHLILLPIYYAGGTVHKDISSDDLARAIASAGKSAEAVLKRDDVFKKKISWESFVVFGARDESLSAFAASLAQKIRTMP